VHVRLALRLRTAPAHSCFRLVGVIGVGAGVVLVVRPRMSVLRCARRDRRDRRDRGDDHHVLDHPWRRCGARGAPGGADGENESEGSEHVWFYGGGRSVLPWPDSTGISASPAERPSGYGRFGSEPSLARAMLFALEPEVETVRDGEQLTSQ